MKISHSGMIITIIVLFLGLIIQPIYYIGIITWRDDYNTAQASARDVIDKVIDSGQLSDETLSAFNLKLASCSMTFTATFYHEVKVTNYDTIKGGDNTITKWVFTEDLTQFNTGDIVSVEIRQVSPNFFQSVSTRTLGSTFTTKPIMFSGMVR